MDTSIAEKLLLLWEYCPDNMFLIRVEGKRDFVIESINPAQQKTMGRNTPVVGRRIEEVIPPPGSRDVIQRYWECLQLKQTLNYEEAGTFIAEDGKLLTRWWRTMLVPLPNDTGEISHLFGVSRQLPLTVSRHK